MERRDLPGLMRVAAVVWVVVALYVLVVEGVLDAEHLWAPYLGIVLWTPIWFIGAWALVLLLRGARRTAQLAWSSAAVLVAAIPSYVTLMDLGKPELFRPDALAWIPLLVLSLAALLAARRR